MMQAIISDIHANLEALEAVLQDISNQGAKEIYCLGDILGFGPNPCECVDALLGCSVTLQSDNDLIILSENENPILNHKLQTHNEWTRKQLEREDPSSKQSQQRMKFLKRLQPVHQEVGFFFVHGSPRRLLNAYIFPEDIYMTEKMANIFSSFERSCIHGKSHVSGIITEELVYHSPQEINNTWKLTGTKSLCNVGSVGQPRDGDARACYVLLDGDTIYYRRVDYDHEKTARKMKDLFD